LFLGKEDEQYRVLGQLPKGEWIEEEWETGVVQLLDQWHRVQELTDPEKFQEQAMEWLIAMAQNPATRGQAAAELHPMRCHNKEHHSDVLCLTIQSASPSQKDRLIQILDDGEDVSEGDLLLYETLRDSTDPRLGQFLLNYLERWETIPALEAYGWRFPEAAAEIWIYDMVTRSQNKDALEYFRDNWKGSISEWRYVGNEVSQFEALQELIRMIRLSQEC
jgi:hypothetical protein